MVGVAPALGNPRAREIGLRWADSQDSDGGPVASLALRMLCCSALKGRSLSPPPLGQSDWHWP